MKTVLCLILAVLAAANSAHGQDIAISRFENGVVTWTNSHSNGYYTVEWTHAVTGAWHSSYSNLTRLAPSGSIMTATVPMFYRIAWTSTPKYIFVDGSYTWTEAKLDAEARGGHLVTITSAQEWNTITNSLALPDERIWIGAHDSTIEGSFEWVTGETWDYTRWDTGQPDAFGSEDWVHMFAPSELEGQGIRLWNDNIVSRNYSYILEYD